MLAASYKLFYKVLEVANADNTAGRSSMWSLVLWWGDGELGVVRLLSLELFKISRDAIRIRAKVIRYSELHVTSGRMFSAAWRKLGIVFLWVA